MGNLIHVLKYTKRLALIAVKILLLFSLKSKRLQRIAGIAPKKIPQLLS